MSTSAVLITGGYGAAQSAEIYHPDRDSVCVLPDLPDGRYHHTQDGSLLCGGMFTPRSCLGWNPDTGAWDLETWLTSSHYGLACSIPDPDTDTAVVTGGRGTLTTVSVYGKEGWIEDFSSGLKTGRFGHGCSSFLSKDNERVINLSF